MTQTPPINELSALVGAKPLLLIAAEPEPLVQAFRATHPAQDILCVEPRQASQAPAQHLERREVALLAGLETRLDADAAVRLIARVRDLYCRQLLVWLSRDDWTAPLVELGLNRCPAIDSRGRAGQLYQHRLDDYKARPDWLDPSDWANPEMWDKYRW